MIKLKRCGFCGKSQGQFQHLFDMKDKNKGIPGTFFLDKCKNCGLMFLNPQPSYKELERYYPKDKYYSLLKIVAGKKSKIRLFLYDLYFNPKNSGYLTKFVLLPLRFYVRGTKIMPGKKLLDIGSGSGQFLYEMKTLGMEVHGIEPGSFDAKVAKKENLDIIKSNLDKTRYKSNCFDLITINHVLEHVNNPVETLKEAYRILKKDGLLIIGVPNNKSLAYWIFKKNWYQLDAPRHLFDYSERNLTKKLKELGFRIKKIRHNSRPSQFLVSFSYLLGKRIKILNMLLFPLALLMTYIVNIFKIGDQIEIYCTK